MAPAFELAYPEALGVSPVSVARWLARVRDGGREAVRVHHRDDLVAEALGELEVAGRVALGLAVHAELGERRAVVKPDVAPQLEAPGGRVGREDDLLPGRGLAVEPAEGVVGADPADGDDAIGVREPAVEVDPSAR